MPQLMTQAAFARHRGVQRSAVSNWKKAGLLVMAEDPADGRVKVDVARSDARINGRVDPGRGRPPSAAADVEAAELPLDDAPAASPAPAGGGETLATVRMDLVRAQTDRARLQNAQSAGELAPVVELQRRMQQVGIAARERLLAWFSSQSERFAAETDVRLIMALGEEGIDDVFAQLADDAATGQFGDGDGDDGAEDDVPDVDPGEVAA